MTTFSAEEYLNLVNEEKEIFEKASSCVSRNPSSELSDFITEILKKIDDLEAFDWDDTVKEAFSKNISLCKETFNKVKDSISTDFSKSEEIYKQCNLEVTDLDDKSKSFKNLIDDEPNKDSYKKTDSETGNVTYNGYHADYDKWEDKCRNKKTECETLKVKIEDDIKELERINGTTIQTEEITLTAVPGVSLSNIVLNEAYHFDMCSPEYRDLKLNDGGGTVGKGGCFMTAAATAISLCLGKQITPADTNKTANKYNMAGVGHRDKLICQFASAYGLNYNYVNKRLASQNSSTINNMLERVQQGDSTIVWAAAKGTKGTYHTGNGHHLNIVDSRKNANGEWEVYVWETAYAPERGNHSISETELSSDREGWHKFSEIYDTASRGPSFIEISAKDIPNANKEYGSCSKFSGVGVGL